MTSALLTLERGPSEITFKRKGFAFLIILITLGFSISFRNRDLGETNLDVQNGVKLVFWLLIIGIAFFKDPNTHAANCLTIRLYAFNLIYTDFGFSDMV